HFDGPQGRQGGDRRRRPGLDRPDRHQGQCQKVRKIGRGDVIGGFAGATADAFTLFERLESKPEQYPGQLTRAAVELAKDWRTDRYLRRLVAHVVVGGRDVSLMLTGTGD